MAPNLEVKSESWLDLSLALLAPRKADKRYFARDAQRREKEFLHSRHRHSIASYFPTSLSTAAATSEPNNISSNQNNINSQREHLLIRLRQQSYLNSRSVSSASLSSNLSRSIELNEVVVSSRASSQVREEPATAAATSKQHTEVNLKKTPARLTSIRESMRAKTRKLPVSTAASAGQSSKSPLVRSFSSLSERLSGEFSRFRHSWKHFLYKCNHEESRSSTLDTRDSFNGRIQSSLADYQLDQLMFGMNQVDKQELTDLWLKRQYQEQVKAFCVYNQTNHKRNERAQSLEVSSQNDAKDYTKVLNTCTSSASLVKRRFPSKSFTYQKEESKEGQYKDYPSSSSTTLVSRSLESLSSSLTPVKSPASIMNQPTSNHSKLRMLERTPTSDYWSLMTNELSDDYYKRQQQAQDFTPLTGTGSPLQNTQNSSNRLTLTCKQDQDYYMEVAKQEQQRQFTQQHQLIGDSIGVDEAANNAAAQTMLMMMYQQNLDEDYEDYAVPADESCRLDRSQVELVQMIGEGQKGYVFLGKLQSKDGGHIQDVAIKTLKYETSQLIERLMREAAMMRQLEHPHIIKFIGVCPETPALIAMELAQFGELKRYLRFNRELLSSSQLVLFAFQISTALSYLESKQYVHRDVAARNVLVCSHNCVKLADFGLSRNLKMLENDPSYDACADDLNLQGQAAPGTGSPSGNNKGHYVASPRGKLPVRWLAPESLAFRRFTSASDVWMFGVFSWELFHFGQIRPWPSIRNNQVLLAIESGQRLPKPPACPARLYQLLQRCWSYAPGQRPKFRELKQILWSIYLTERTREQLELERQQRAQQLQVSQIEQARRRAEQLAIAIATSNSTSNVAHLLRLSASPLPGAAGTTATYSSYSSTATTHSNDDSSRSSTMNSLHAHQRRQQQQQQQQAASPSCVAPASQPDPSPNQRRFQNRAGNGHLLRKQRSQGSITTKQVQEPLNSNNVRYPSQGLFYNESFGAKATHEMQPLASSRDDLWLPDSFARHSQQLEQRQQQQQQFHQRAVGGSRPVSFQFFYEPKLAPTSARFTNSPAQMEGHSKGKKKELNMLEDRLARLQVDDQLVVEPAYEGVYRWQTGEVAMIRSSELSQAQNQQQFHPHQHHLMQDPNAFQELEAAPRIDLSRPVPASQLVQLTNQYPQVGRHLVRASKLKQPSQHKQSKSEERERNRPGKGAATAATCQVREDTTGSSGSSKIAGKPLESEEQRQFALHERLLGRIRPDFDGKRKSSSSMSGGSSEKQDALGDSSTRKEPATVEQSLELLESLIKGKNFTHQQASSKNSSSSQHESLKGKRFSSNQVAATRLAVKRL